MTRFRILVAALVTIAITAASPVVFEDFKSDSRSDDFDIESRALVSKETPIGQQLDEDSRHHHNHNRRKNKRIICGLAHLIAKREADSGLRSRRQTTEQGRGLGVVGFLLGAFVGSKYQHHQYQYQGQPLPPHQQQQGQGQQQQQQQGVNNEDYDQVEDQGGGGGLVNNGGGGHGGGNHGGGGQGGGGGLGGGGLCNSLQLQNVQQHIGGVGSGSHPVLASLLTNGGGGGGGGGPNKIGQLAPNQSPAQLSQFQRPSPAQFSQYQRPVPVSESQFQRPAPVNEPQVQRPAPVQIQPQPQPRPQPAVQQPQQSGFVNTFVRPWVDLFL